MHLTERQKMCIHCDGRIPLDAKICPYCATDLSGVEAQGMGEGELHHQSLQESLTSLYPPSYAGKSASLHLLDQKKQAPTIRQPQPPNEFMVEKRFNNSNAALGIPTIPIDSIEEQHTDEGRTSFWPILLLSLGANLLTVGLLQLFFSDNGYLRLEWNSSYWFVYCLGALPLFFFGFKRANGIKS